MYPGREPLGDELRQDMVNKTEGGLQSGMPDVVIDEANVVLPEKLVAEHERGERSAERAHGEVELADVYATARGLTRHATAFAREVVGDLQTKMQATLEAASVPRTGHLSVEEAA